MAEYFICPYMGRKGTNVEVDEDIEGGTLTATTDVYCSEKVPIVPYIYKNDDISCDGPFSTTCPYPNAHEIVLFQNSEHSDQTDGIS